MGVLDLLTAWFTGPDNQVRRALNRLRPDLARISPPVTEWHVLPFPVRDGGVAVYLACDNERDRPALEAHLPEVEPLIRQALITSNGVKAFKGPLFLQAASREQISREGGIYGYSHNH